MHKKGASSVSKPIVVDLDGRPVTPADDEEFMMMSDAIMDDNDGLKSPSNAHSQIRITDDLRGHTVAPRRARSTFADGELRRQSRLDVAKTSKPMPVVKPVAPTTPVAAPAPNVQKNAVTSSVKTAKPNPPKLPTASPELALARGPSPTNPVTPTSGGTPQSNNTCNTCVLHVILKKEKTTAKDQTKKMDKTPESDSIKTALDIDTINFKDAKKYSFLNKEGHSVYEPKIDFAELSDFDLYANSQMQKPANKPDMKKLEAYFAVPAGKPKAEKNAPQPEVRKSASTKTAKPVVERQRKSNMKLLGKFRDRNNRKPNKTSTEEVDGDKSSKSIRKKGKRKNEGKGSDEKKSSGAGAFLQRLLRRKEVTIASKKEEKTAKTPPPVQKT